MVFTFAIDINQVNAKLTGPGILWASIAFAGVTGLNRAFALELEGNTLEALMLAPISRDLIYVGKMFGNFLFLTASQIIVVPIFAVLFNLAVLRWEMLVISLLTTIGFSAIGTLFAAMLIMAAVESTSHVVNDGSWPEIAQWIQLALAFDIAFIVISAFIFQQILED